MLKSKASFRNNNTTETNVFHLDITIVGVSNTGKKALSSHFSNGFFFKEMELSHDKIRQLNKQITTMNGNIINLTVNIQNLDNYHATHDISPLTSNAIIFVYNVNDKSSFEFLDTFYDFFVKAFVAPPADNAITNENNNLNNINNNNFGNYYFSNNNNNGRQIPLLFVVGNKTDLDEREVSENDIEDMKLRLKDIPFYECSCFTGDNVETIFDEITVRLEAKVLATILGRKTSGNNNSSNSGNGKKSQSLKDKMKRWSAKLMNSPTRSPLSKLFPLSSKAMSFDETIIK
ncbi:hypothetical protein ABK040_015051 [Willaertia magna]